MKKEIITLIVFIIFLVFSSSITAQDWQYNFEEAQKIAQETDKNIVLVFTGSDWCPPCKKLERKVFLDPEFQEFAKSNFVWVKADFPKRKKNRLSDEQQNINEALAERYNKKKSFPVILVIDAEGKVLGATGYRKMPPKRYIKLLTTFDSFGN